MPPGQAHFLGSSLTCSADSEDWSTAPGARDPRSSSRSVSSSWLGDLEVGGMTTRPSQSNPTFAGRVHVSGVTSPRPSAIIVWSCQERLSDPGGVTQGLSRDGLVVHRQRPGATFQGICRDKTAQTDTNVETEDQTALLSRLICLPWRMSPGVAPEVKAGAGPVSIASPPPSRGILSVAIKGKAMNL